MPTVLIPGQTTNAFDDAELLHSDRHAGHVLVDGVEVAMTLQCCHCNAHWIHYKSQLVLGLGKKRTRGFCTHCMRVTCGDAKCDPCVPFEQKLDLYERQQLGVLG